MEQQIICKICETILEYRTVRYHRINLGSRADEKKRRLFVTNLEGHMGLADVLDPDRAPDLLPRFIFTSQD
jgi:hypothetical protein